MTTDSQLTQQIIKAVIKVHQTLGPGFLERIYQNALVIELTRQGLAVESEKEISIYYEGDLVGVHRLDLVIEGHIIIELKTVENLVGIHYAQVRSYLNATQLDTGLLINFASDKADYRRVESTPK